MFTYIPVFPFQVAQRLAALRRSDWVAGLQQSVVKVSVADVRVERQVKLKDFRKWLERTNVASPKEMTQRQRIRSPCHARPYDETVAGQEPARAILV